MKKLIALVSAVCSAVFVQAEQLDHWEITKDDGGQAYISDNVWTFKAELRSQQLSSNPDIRQLRVGACTQWPSEVTALDFSKAIVNNTGDGKTYGFWSVCPEFSTGDKYNANHIAVPTAAAAFVGALTFPHHEYDFQIGSHAFAACPNLVFDLSGLPINTSFIDGGAFAFSPVTGTTPELTKLTMLSEYVFMGCANIVGINAPNVTRIGRNASCSFYHCTSLKTVIVGEYTQLAGNSFDGCTSLTHITPFISSACAPGREAFKGCSSLAQPVVYSGDSAIHNNDSSYWDTFNGCSSIPSVDYSLSSMTAVPRGYFSGCSSLKWVKFPATLQDSGAVFSGCTSLERIEFKSVPANIDLNSECTALSEVHFYNCAPTEVPASIFKNLAQTQVVTTYLHDMNDDQLDAWAVCTENGALSADSTWSKAIAGDKAYLNRPLVVFSEKHVQIAAGANVVLLDGQRGTFIVSRGDEDTLAGNVLVSYTVSGEAQSGVDFAELPGVVTIPSGQKSATVEVDGLYTGVESVKNLTVTLKPSEDYILIEGKTTASISVVSGRREVFVEAVKDASRPLGQIGFFRVSRGENDSTLGDLEVALTFDGTAVNGVTYKAISPTVTIPAGQREIEVEVFPLDDQNVLADSTVIVSVAVGLYSIVGEPATVNILYGDGSYGCWRIYKEGTQAYLTDGTWTFKCGLQGSLVSTGDAYRLDVGGATVWPDVVSPLDFSKGFIHEYDNRTYKIGQWAMSFGTPKNNYKEVEVTPAGDVVGAVTLVDGEHDAAFVGATFAGCANMVFDLATMPKNITTVGAGAFLYSSAAGAVSAPRLTQIQSSAFRGCQGVTALTASNIVQILDSAFQDAAGLVSVDLGPDEDCGLTKIGSSAFQGCTSLESFTPFLPSSLDVLNARGAFMNCSNLETPLVFKGSDLGEDHKGWNGTQMFENCAKIPSADLSESTITALRREAFNGCVALKEVKLPATFVEFGNPNTAVDSQEYYPNINTDPFNGCSGIKLYLNSPKMPVKNSSTDVNVPMNIAGISEIVIGENMSELEDGAFSKAEYSNLTNVTFVGAKPATVGADLFADQKVGQITAYVPGKELASWKPVATDQIITKNAGEWVSGTAQQIRSYGMNRSGLLIIVR